MKKIFILLSFSLILFLSSCNFSFDGNNGEIIGNLTKLPSPMDVRVEDDTIYWNSVSNANGYVVKINTYTDEVTSTSKLIGSIMDVGERIPYDTPTVLSISVCAKGNSIYYSDSDWSQEINYTYTKVEKKTNENVMYTLKCVSSQNANMLEDYISVKDASLYYYIFKLGTIYNVQLDDGTIIFYDGYTDTENSEEKHVTTTTEVKSYVSSATSNSVKTIHDETENWDVKYSKSSTDTLKGTISVTDNNGNSASAEASSSVNRALTVAHAVSTYDSTQYSSTESLTESYEESKRFSLEESKKTSYSFTSKNPSGKYLKALFGNLDVFSVVMLNPSSNEYEVCNFSVVRNQSILFFYLGKDVQEYKNEPDVKLELSIGSIENILKIPPTNYIEIKGDGTQINPYLVSSASDLFNISDNMNACYKLICDIDLSKENWKPIGGCYLKNEFNGVLDGNGHSIIGLNNTTNVDEVNGRSFYGLFGCVGKNGVVKNLTFKDVNLKFTGPALDDNGARCFFGIVAGKCMGKIINVETYGELNYTNFTNGESWIGGICGYLVNGVIDNCTNNAKLGGNRYSLCLGGICGYADGGKILNCTNNGDLYATGGAFGGGTSWASGVCCATNKSNQVGIVSFVNTGKIEAYSGGGWVHPSVRSNENEVCGADWDENY